ncbi:translin-associated factor X-interacting protein 1 [Centroberyx gerrardi]
MSAGGQEGENTVAVSVKPSAKMVCWTGSDYLYAGPGRKPRFLRQLESYVNRELQTINPHEPELQELKLQVYRDVFGRFIEEFKTYQPLLCAIKKEYENTLVYQQLQIRDLEPLRCHLRLVTEECDRRIRARWEEEQALEREKQQLQKDVEAMREKETVMQTLVAHLQSELADQYLLYQEQSDAHETLIAKLNDLTSCSVKEEEPAHENTEGEDKDPVMLRLALRVCREDLTKAQVELNRIQAEYWDVVPRRNWETLEHTHQQTLLQLERLQGDFDQLRSEHDTLLELHKRGSMHAESDRSITEQMDESVHHRQNQLQSNLLKVLIHSDASESGTLTVQEFRAALRTALPLKSDQAIDALVASAESELDSSNDTIAYQRLYSLGANGKNGEFLSLVMRQSLEDRQLYISQLRVQLGDKGEVSVSDLRAALMCIDPALDSDALDWSLSLAFQVKKEELNQCDTLLDRETVLQRLVSVLPRQD